MKKQPKQQEQSARVSFRCYPSVKKSLDKLAKERGYPGISDAAKGWVISEFAHPEWKELQKRLTELGAGISDALAAKLKAEKAVRVAEDGLRNYRARHLRDTDTITALTAERDKYQRTADDLVRTIDTANRNNAHWCRLLKGYRLGFGIASVLACVAVGVATYAFKRPPQVRIVDREVPVPVPVLVPDTTWTSPDSLPAEGLRVSAVIAAYRDSSTWRAFDDGREIIAQGWKSYP